MTAAREEVREPFIDGVTDGWCELVVPPGGKVYPEASEPKIGVAHSRCNALADLAIELDAFFCAACHRNGRISGDWCLEVIEEAGSP